MKPLINITIPVYNRGHLTQKTILRLHRCRCTSETVPFCITVVDNGSEEGLRRALVRLAQESIIDHLFLLPRNMGISCACNIGWKHVDAPYFVKLDNNAVIHEFSFLTTLLQLAQCVDPRSTLGPAYDYAWIEKNPTTRTTPFGVLAKCQSNLPGCGLLIPKEVSRFLGYFSEDYGLYGAEDGDYGLRMNAIGFDQWYYDHRPFFTKYYTNEEHYDIDKAGEHRRLFSDEGHIGYFPLNYLLYSYCIRSWKVPPKYATIHRRGYDYDVVVRDDYHEIAEALKRSQKILELWLYRHGSLCKQPLSHEIVAKLKEIWKACGQECVSENLAPSDS